MRRARGFTLIELMIVIAIIAILSLILLPNMARARAQGHQDACVSNLKTVATATEGYGVDNGGRYPTTIAGLTPSYMAVVPTCPAVGADTYTAGYVTASVPDAYTVVCAGTNHNGTNLPTNYPQYTSQQGLVLP